MNPFTGRTKAWLEARLAEAQVDLANGSSAMGVNAGDGGFTDKVHMSPIERITLLMDALNALDPVAFPEASIRRVSKTRASFG